MGFFNKKNKLNKVLKPNRVNLADSTDRTEGLGKATNLVYEYDRLESELRRLNTIYPYTDRSVDNTIHVQVSYGCTNYAFGVTAEMLDLGMSQIYKRMREIEKVLNTIQEIGGE